jgi:uridine phosphorylase
MVKLYGDFTQEDWLRLFGVEESRLPSSFIIHGEWVHEDNLNIWKEVLKDEIWFPKWNTIIGKHNERNIGFANVYGGPIAATITHQFASVGADVFIQTGYCGGLSFDVKYGDIVIVTEAEMQDGISHWYLPYQTTVKSDEKLLYEAIDYCEKKGYSYVTGSVISMGAMLLETEEMVKAWSSNDHLGVDMETATTLAVAKKFGKRAIGLLNLSDQLLQGNTLDSYTKEREEIEAETDEKIRDVALYLSSNVVKK